MRLVLGAFLLGSLSFGCKKEDENFVAAGKVKNERGAERVPLAPEEPPPWSSRVSPEPGFPCEVEGALRLSCRRCHWEPQENDAPFGMVRFEDVHRTRSGKPVFLLMQQMLEADLMPPLDALVSPSVTPLPPEAKEVLLTWLRAGAPRSLDRCQGTSE